MSHRIEWEMSLPVAPMRLASAWLQCAASVACCQAEGWIGHSFRAASAAGWSCALSRVVEGLCPGLEVHCNLSYARQRPVSCRTTFHLLLARGPDLMDCRQLSHQSHPLLNHPDCWTDSLSCPLRRYQHDLASCSDPYRPSSGALTLRLALPRDATSKIIMRKMTPLFIYVGGVDCNNILNYTRDIYTRKNIIIHEYNNIF